MKWQEKYTTFLFILPALAYMVYFSFFPTINAVYQSFQTPVSHFVPSNYEGLMGFGLPFAIFNTVVISVGALALQFALAFIVALVLRREFKGKGIFSTVFLLPFGIATVVAAFSFTNIFATTGGYANSFLKVIGLHPINWFSNWWLDIFTVVVSDSWKNTPIVTLILLAGMGTIPDDLYQAASVDGANAVKRFFHITLPNLRNYVAIALIIRGLSEFNIFALPLILLGYRPVLLTTLTYEFYSTTASVYYSYASATVLLAFILVFFVVVMKLRSGQ
ncbi:MAG: sugar ABC transporter permease [Nitrososphaerota archaeon]|jgi:trehalose transport system permease protein|nr:sugar ABC transporter permease [Nitrososphaerota archaeon]